MTGIRRVSQLGTTGESTYVDGSIFDVDIHASANIAQSKIANLTSNLAAKAPVDSPVFNAGNINLSRTSAEAGAIVGGLNFKIDNSNWAQIFMTDVSEMRVVSARVNFDGNIRTPNQYCYNGDHTGAAAVSYSGTPVIPNNTYFNIGGCYNASNGRFTVPVAGYVLCSFNSLITRNLAASHAYVHFAVDGVKKSVATHTVYDILGNYQSLNNTAIVYCPANSYVTAVLTTPQASAYGGEYGLGLTYRFLG